MNRRLFAFLASFALLFVASARGGEQVTVAFWNVQNLFDEFSDEEHPKATVPKAEDVKKKLANRARVLKEMNADVVGFSEVENRSILRRLCKDELKEAGYPYYVLLDEKDERGIDVALASRHPFFAQSFEVPGFYRGVLACRFSVKGEPFYVLVNHWKSRAITGQAATEPQRLECSRRVREIAEKELPAFEGRPVPVIVIGDLNDDDTDKSVLALEEAGFTNTLKKLPPEKRWSHAYYNRDERKVVLNSFDHILFNSTLRDSSTIRWKEGNAEVVRYPYLIRKRKINGEQHDWPADDYGKNIGYSDHLPVKATFDLPTK